MANANYRVLKFWANRGEDQAYTIVDVYNRPGTNQPELIYHKGLPEFSVAAYAYSIDELRTQLKSMLEALDNKPMFFLGPSRLIPAKLVVQPLKEK